MKSISFVLALFFLQIYYSCIQPNEKEKEREQRRQEKLLEHPEEIEIARSDALDTTDYRHLKISDDSLDLKLYELITLFKDFDETILLKNIETLILLGAKPDALVETTYLVRKTGTYIPIVKHFYQNKYREYTKVTTSMHAAIGTGNLKIVAKLLEHGGNINVLNTSKLYPLDIALMTDNNDMIDYLLKSGADLKNVNLANTQNTTVIEKLVKQGANPKTIDINYALSKPLELKRLLALKPDIDKNELEFNIIMNDDQLLDLLLNNGMTPNATGKFPDDGCPAIFAAIKYNNFKAFKKLHSKGASLTKTCRSGFGESPLQRAVYYQRLDVIKYLLEHKVSANEKAWTKKSVLTMACNTDNDSIINILIDAGAQLEYTGYFNKTPLMDAVESDKYISVECLLKRNANVNFRTGSGMTPLLEAIEKNNYPMIKLLVEYGANTKIKFQNQNIVQFAEQENASPAIVSYLKTLVK